MQADGQSYRTLTLDTEHYLAMLDAPDLSDDEKHDMIEALWLFVVSFTDLDYRVLVENSCGQVREESGGDADRPLPVLNCSQPNNTKTFAEAANLTRAPRREQEAS